MAAPRPFQPSLPPRCILSTTLTRSDAATDSRFKRLFAELQHALDGVTQDDITRWGKRSVRRFPTGMVERGDGILRSGRRAATGLADEITDGIVAASRSEFGQHLSDRAVAAREGTRRALRDVGAGTRDAVIALIDLCSRPLEAAPVIFGAVGGFLLGSGGLDGDGGIPDLDWDIPFLDHRSVLTHSIISGVAVEVVILSCLDLVIVLHSHLPPKRDPMWDAMAECAVRFSRASLAGTSAGIAYHLAVDSVMQPAPYKDLPIKELPIEIHQALLGTNAVAEGLMAMRHAGIKR